MANGINRQVVSREFLARRQQEIQAGEVLQGYEKLWGAVAHMTKAVAQRMGGSIRTIELCTW